MAPFMPLQVLDTNNTRSKVCDIPSKHNGRILSDAGKASRQRGSRLPVPRVSRAAVDICVSTSGREHNEPDNSRSHRDCQRPGLSTVPDAGGGCTYRRYAVIPGRLLDRHEVWRSARPAHSRLDLRASSRGIGGARSAILVRGSARCGSDQRWQPSPLAASLARPRASGKC